MDYRQPAMYPLDFWNFGINYKKMSPGEVARMLEEGRIHLKCCAKLYRRQLKHGRHFIHEHPASAFSWREPEIDPLANDARTYAVVCDP